MDTFRILSPNQVAYLDLTGSVVETIAHVRENGRIVFMICSTLLWIIMLSLTLVCLEGFARSLEHKWMVRQFGAAYENYVRNMARWFPWYCGQNS